MHRILRAKSCAQSAVCLVVMHAQNPACKVLCAKCHVPSHAQSAVCALIPDACIVLCAKCRVLRAKSCTQSAVQYAKSRVD